MSNTVKPYAWVLFVRPGYELEYQRRHDELWPDMYAELDASGIKKYHIFRHGLTLFGYFETADIAATQAYLAASDINAKWSEYMAPIMQVDIDPVTNFPFLLPQMMDFNEGAVAATLPEALAKISRQS
ncbi:MAG: L-rhamnose mutarotase [Sphingomonadales bacterium]|nr:L-rhamnose mutarotase [Sphingomonadales bacterium]